jgi:hypothetical protein
MSGPYLVLQPSTHGTSSPELTPRFPASRLPPSLQVTTNNPLADTDSPVRDAMSSVDCDTAPSSKGTNLSAMLSVTPIRHMVPKYGYKGVPAPTFDKLSRSMDFVTEPYTSTDSTTAPLLQQPSSSGSFAPDLVTPSPRCLPHAPQNQTPLAATNPHKQALRAVQESSSMSTSEASGTRGTWGVMPPPAPQPQMPVASMRRRAAPRRAEPDARRHSRAPARQSTRGTAVAGGNLAADLMRSASATRTSQPIGAGGPTLDQILAGDHGDWSRAMLHDTGGSTGSRGPAGGAAGSVAASEREPAPTPVPVRLDTAEAEASGASADAYASGSEDWDVMGTQTEDARAPTPSATAVLLRGAAVPTATAAARGLRRDRSAPQLARSGAAAAAAAERERGEDPRLNRVPTFDTGEPQFTWGDGGGRPPSTSVVYQAVMSAAVETRAKPQQLAMVRVFNAMLLDSMHGHYPASELRAVSDASERFAPAAPCLNCLLTKALCNRRARRRP